MSAALIAGEVLALVVALGAMLFLGWYDSVPTASRGAGARVVPGACVAAAVIAATAMVLLAMAAGATAA